MKKFLAILLLGLSSLVTAQTVQTTPNLITSGTNHTWYGVTTGTLPSNYMPGGPTPIYDPSTNTVSFSYNSNASVGQTMAINQALAGVGAGVKINGYNYSYDVRNMNGDDRQPGIDTFTVSQLLRGPANSVLLSSSQYYNTKFEWRTVTGTKVATTPYNIADTSYIQFGVQGGDNGFWGGYFGPQIRNVNMSLNYSIDPCTTNPAFSPTCANYNTVSTSANLLQGTTGPQAYAINQALAFAGAGATIHGFDYGYSYNVAGRQCAIWNLFGVCLSGWDYSDAGVNTSITNSAGTTTYTDNQTHNGGDNGVSGAYNKALRLSSSVPIATLGTFSMSPWTSGSASITNMYSKAVYTADPCLDPLASPSCPGYAAAYMTQQCTANPLYNSACPGYAQALFTQQCNANQMSNPACPGYASAYLTYQCTLDPLYSTTCAGYETAYFNQQCSLDPLYSNRCSGYATAYHNQQCSINPLYASDCTGYAAAYLTQQCTADPLYSNQCSGYANAYHTQQCGISALYASDCPGYQAAYKAQQCSISALYATDCPGYAQAYLAQQCSLNSLYNNQCPGYSEAYAKKMLLEQQSVTSTPTQTVVATVAVADPTTQATAISSDATVNAAVTTKTTAASSETNPAAAVKLVAPAPTAAAVVQTETKKDEGKQNGSSNNSNSPSADSKPSDQPKSNREALAERRREAAQKEAVAKGKDLANEMGKAADLEAQKAVQNVVIQAMGFTPGFDTYNKSTIPDTVFYKPYQVYGNQRNVDNQQVGRRLMGGSDRVHQEMIDSQYQLGK